MTVQILNLWTVSSPETAKKTMRRRKRRKVAVRAVEIHNKGTRRPNIPLGQAQKTLVK